MEPFKNGLTSAETDTIRELDADLDSTSVATREGTRTPKKHERPGQPPRALSVELLRRYSNREDLLKSLVSLLERINEQPSADVEAVQLASADGPVPRAWQINRRLTPTDIKTLVAAYCAGSTIKVLAEQYAISTTSVKRLLREHGAQRPRGAA